MEYQTRSEALCTRPKGCSIHLCGATPWNLTSIQESNDKGSWFNYQLAGLEMEFRVSRCEALPVVPPVTCTTHTGTQDEMKQAVQGCIQQH